MDSNSEKVRLVKGSLKVNVDTYGSNDRSSRFPTIDSTQYFPDGERCEPSTVGAAPFKVSVIARVTSMLLVGRESSIGF